MRNAKVLSGLRLVITRPRRQAHGLAQALQARGATTILVPSIEIEPYDDLRHLHHALSNLSNYDWLVFTSVNGVRITWKTAEERSVPIELEGGPRLAAIGPATARALVKRGWQPDFVPEEFLAEAVVEGLLRLGATSVLLPRAEGAREVLPAELSARGVQVDEIPIYRVVSPAVTPESLSALAEGVDLLTFTSPSTAEHFVEIVSRAGMDPIYLPGDPRIACIGPITARAAASLGFAPSIIAEAYTTEGLVEAIESFYRKEAIHGNSLPG